MLGKADGKKTVPRHTLCSLLIALTIHAVLLVAPAWPRSLEVQERRAGNPFGDHSSVRRTTKAEQAVEEALRWLAEHQNDVEGWNLRYREESRNIVRTSVLMFPLHIFNSYRSVKYAIHTFKPTPEADDMSAWDLD